MALVKGSITIHTYGATVGTGLSKEIYDAIVATGITDDIADITQVSNQDAIDSAIASNTPPPDAIMTPDPIAQEAANKKYTFLASAIADAVVEHIKLNMEIGGTSQVLSVTSPTNNVT